MLHEPRQEKFQYHVFELARKTQQNIEITNETPDIQMRRSHSLLFSGREKKTSEVMPAKHVSDAVLT